MMGTMGTFARLETPTMANPFFVGFSGNTGICPPRQRPLPECGGAANANQSPPVLQAISGAGEPLSWIYIHPHPLRARAPRKVPLSWLASVGRHSGRAAGWIL